MLNDSHSPHSQTGQLEVMAEMGFALATRPSGKEQDSKADGEVKKSAFPSVLLLLRDLYYGISKIKKTLRKKKNHELSLRKNGLAMQHYSSRPAAQPNRDSDTGPAAQISSVSLTQTFEVICSVTPGNLGQ